MLATKISAGMVIVFAASVVNSPSSPVRALLTD